MALSCSLTSLMWQTGHAASDPPRDRGSRLVYALSAPRCTRCEPAKQGRRVPTAGLVPPSAPRREDQSTERCLRSLDSLRLPSGETPVPPVASPVRQLLADFVAKVADGIDEGALRTLVRPLAAARSSRSGGCDALILTPATQHGRYPTLTPRNAATVGGGLAASLASRRRFWAMAASVNSNWAPRGPRNLRRPSRRMRFRWANSISTRLRSRHDCSKASVLASARATSRASS